MLIEQFEERGLSHHSYAVGCKEKSQIAIIDPRFDVDIYLEYAEKNGLIISHVLETHIHGDSASGARMLAARARATLILSGYDKGEMYEVTFPHQECFDGDHIKIGSITLEVLHTPGHTPEHVSYLVYEKDEPKILFSGDFIFVGFLGRPEPLGEGAADRLSQKLYESVKNKLHHLPHTVQVFPTHSLGCLCYAKMANRPFSTISQEWLTNSFLKPNLSKEEFIAHSLICTPPATDYFYQMKAYNTSNQQNKLSFPPSIDIETFQKQMKKGDIVIDLRDEKAFASGHIPESISLGSCDRMGFWAAWMIPFNSPLLIITDDPTRIENAVKSLARVGFCQIRGYLKGGVETWKRAQLPLIEISKISPFELNKDKSHYQIVDVRTLEEWNMGHIDSAKHMPCFDLPRKMDEISTDKLIFVCAGSYRSSLASSYVKHIGHKSVSYVSGGIPAWQAANLPLVTD